MSISEHSSTPAVVNGSGTGTITTASFSPPAGSLLVALAGAGWGTGASQSITITDSGAHTWTQIAQAQGPSGDFGAAAVRCCYLASAPGSITVTSTVSSWGSGGGRYLAVRVLTGASSSQSSATGHTRVTTTGATTTGEITFSTTTAGSVVYGISDEPSSTITSASSVSGTTVISTYADSNDQVGLSGWKSTSATGTPGSTIFGVSWSASGAFGNVAAFEVLPPPTDSVSASLSASTSLNAAATVTEQPATTLAASTLLSAAAPVGTQYPAAALSVSTGMSVLAWTGTRSIGYVSATSASGSSVTTSSVSTTVPTGSVNDLLLIAVAASSTSAGYGSPFITTAAAQLSLLWSFDNSDYVAMYVYYRYVKQSDPTTYSFSSSSGAPLSVVALRYNGVSPFNRPFRDLAGNACLDEPPISIATSRTFPPLTNVAPDDLVVTFMAQGKGTKSASIDTMSVPSSWTQRAVQTGPTAAGAYPVQLAAFDKFGDGTGTASVSGDSGAYDGFSVALIPSDSVVTEPPGGTITFRSAATAASTSTGATSLSVNRPSGTQDGDLLILAAGQSRGYATFTVPSGWTPIEMAAGGYSAGTVNSKTDICTQVWYKVANGEPTSYPVGCTTDAGAVAPYETVLGVVSYYGVRSPNPISLHASTWQQGAVSATSVTPMALPGINATNLVVVIYGFGADGTGTINVNYPASGGWTPRALAKSAVSGDYNGALVFVDQLGASATNTTTANVSGTWTAHSISLVGTIWQLSAVLSAASSVTAGVVDHIPATATLAASTGLIVYPAATYALSAILSADSGLTVAGPVAVTATLAAITKMVIGTPYGALSAITALTASASDVIHV